MLIVVGCILGIVAAVLTFLLTQPHPLGAFFRGLKYQTRSDIGGLISLVLGFFMKQYNKVDEYPDRKGQTAVVTGGGRGLGIFVIRGLAKCGMHVAVGVRRPELCIELAKEIAKENHPGTVEFLTLDTSSLASVKAFADKVKEKHREIHLLVNNAGVIDHPFKITEDGFEAHLATNYIGHFYLTHLLFNNLIMAGKVSGLLSRIVNLSSCAHAITNIHYEDINMEDEFHLLAAYSQSKLAQLMFSRHLDRELVSHDLPVRSYAVHPGIVDTQMTKKFKSNYTLVGLLMKMMKSPLEGAITVLYCCLSDKLEGTGGQFISDCKPYFSTSFSKSVNEQNRLFDYTKNVLNIKNFGSIE